MLCLLVVVMAAAAAQPDAQVLREARAIRAARMALLSEADRHLVEEAAELKRDYVGLTYAIGSSSLFLFLFFVFLCFFSPFSPLILSSW